MLRWSEPIALLELAGEVRLRGEAAAQRDVTNGLRGMGWVGQLSMRQGQAFPPDPLCDAALVLLEHAVQVAQRHCHVVGHSLRVELAVCEVFCDETLGPQEAKPDGVFAAWREPAAGSGSFQRW